MPRITTTVPWPGALAMRWRILEQPGCGQGSGQSAWRRMTGLARSPGHHSFDERGCLAWRLTLGGGEVRLLELTAAYAAFDQWRRRGRSVSDRPRWIDANGQHVVLLSAARHRPSRCSIRESHSLITDILERRRRASAVWRDSVLNLTRPAAVKTGTTTDWRDNWTVGYTPGWSSVCGRQRR